MHWLRAFFSVYGRRGHSVQFLVHTALSSIPSPIHVCRAFSALIHLHLTQKNVAKARAKGAYGEEVTLSFQSLIQYYTVSPGLVYTLHASPGKIRKWKQTDTLAPQSNRTTQKNLIINVKKFNFLFNFKNISKQKKSEMVNRRK